MVLSAGMRSLLESFLMCLGSLLRLLRNLLFTGLNLFQVVDIGKNHYSIVIEQPLGSLYVNFKDI